MSRRVARPLRVAAVVLVLGLGTLVGCGGDDRARDPSPSATKSATPMRYATVVHETAAGGEVGSVVRLDSDHAVSEFTAQFTRPGLAEKIRAVLAVHDLRPGDVMVGRVVSIGCDIPQVLVRDEGELLVAARTPKSTNECFAAMTSVALAAVPEAEAPQPTGGA